MVWLNVISDSLIALSYFSIPFALLWLVRKRRDLPFGFVLILFGVFILTCGSTHVLEVWNLWHSEYWLVGILKAITAVASIGTAVVVARLLPQAVEVPSISKWRTANAALESEIQERRELEVSLRSSAASFSRLTVLQKPYDPRDLGRRIRDTLDLQPAKTRALKHRA